MNLPLRLFLAAASTACFALAAAHAALPDVANDPMYIAVGPKPSTFHLLRTNQVMVIEATNGAKAFLQLTSATRTNATHRWRYRAPHSDQIQSGSGSVCYAITQVKMSNGMFREIRASEHNIVIQAGGLKILWERGIPSRI